MHDCYNFIFFLFYKTFFIHGKLTFYVLPMTSSRDSKINFKVIFFVKRILEKGLMKTKKIAFNAES